MENLAKANQSSSSAQPSSELSATLIQSTDLPTIGASEKTPMPTSVTHTQVSAKATWMKWFAALKAISLLYLAIHLTFLFITCFAFLFLYQDFSTQSASFSRLWLLWLHWDTINFRAIAVHGYTVSWLTAFFPLYPLLERGLTYLTHDTLIAGLIISNLCGLGMLMVLYRLVCEDFNAEYACRTVLYLSVFPTAFFFAAAYSESLFLLLALLSFYHVRRSHWWLAGLFGLLAALTRVSGLLLLLPFCYDYARQHDFKLREIRFDILSGGCIVAGIALFALYCSVLFHDPLAFSHAEALWNRKLSVPGYAMLRSVKAMMASQGILSFQFLRNILDLMPDLFVCVLVILCFVGPWKIPRNLWAYALFAAIFFLFPQLFPFGGLYPLESIPRYLLAVFPVFIVLAAMGKNRTLEITYLLISGSLLFLLLTQFLTGHWIT